MANSAKILLLSLLLCLLTVAAATLVYRAGYKHAEALGRAELAKRLAGEQQASADGLRAEKARFQEEARRAFLTDFALQKERKLYAQEKEKLMARIATVARGSSLLGPGAVGLWNEAIGARVPALPGPDHSAGADAASCRTDGPDAGYPGRGQ